MLDFNRVLHVEGLGHLFFCFNCILSSRKRKYHVTVTHSSESYHFTMTENNGNWKIADAPLPPEWILNLEDRLDHAIRQMQ